MSFVLTGLVWLALVTLTKPLGSLASLTQVATYYSNGSCFTRRG